MQDDLTLREAAEVLGLKDASALRHATRRGLLQTERVGPLHVTTPDWLAAYVAHVQAHKGGRGTKRGPRPTATAPTAQP